MTLRPIKLTDIRDLPDGRQVEVFVDIDDTALDAWLARPGQATDLEPWTDPILIYPYPFDPDRGLGEPAVVLTLRVVDRSEPKHIAASAATEPRTLVFKNGETFIIEHTETVNVLRED